MRFFIAMLLVTLPLILHGSEQVQGKLYHSLKCWSLMLLKEMNQADTSAWCGMALEATAPSPVQLMFIVSNAYFKNEITVDGMN